MDKKMLLIMALVSLILLSGCDDIKELYGIEPLQSETYVPIEEVKLTESDCREIDCDEYDECFNCEYTELPESCEYLSDYDSVEKGFFPKTITIDDNITINANELPTDKFNIFNMSKRVEDMSNGIIRLRIFDCDGILIYNSDSYTRCDLSTINRLIELNATDILYDVCVGLPRICDVEVMARFSDNKHKVVICWE